MTPLTKARSARIGGVQVFHVLEAAARQALPFRKTLRTLKRKLRPYDDDPGNSAYCITNGLEMIAALRDAGVDPRGKTILEFGSGWLPLIPWLFHLAGAQSLVLTDIDRLMDDQTVERARNIVQSRLKDVSAVLGQSGAVLLDRLCEPMLSTYLVPWRAEEQLAESADIIISRACFEHVPEEQLVRFLYEFRRILRPGGVMCHVIDNSDHWQHRDRSLSRVNFLRFDEESWFWRMAQHNPQAYQNRLRHGDYRALMERVGFDVIAERGTPDPQCMRDLAQLPLDPRFRGRAARDMAILISLFVARRA